MSIILRLSLTTTNCLSFPLSLSIRVWHSRSIFHLLVVFFSSGSAILSCYYIIGQLDFKQNREYPYYSNKWYHHFSCPDEYIDDDSNGDKYTSINQYFQFLCIQRESIVAYIFTTLNATDDSSNIFSQYWSCDEKSISPRESRRHWRVCFRLFQAFQVHPIHVWVPTMCSTHVANLVLIF